MPIKEEKKSRNVFIKILRILGPGFITGASDDDPSGISTYSQTGAQFGYRQLWTAALSFPFMVAVQETCGRIGMVTGHGLARVIRQNYSPVLLYFAVGLLVLANTINIGADLCAMAASAKLIIDIPYIIWLIAITLVTVALEIFIPYKRYVGILKFFTLSLFCYVITVFVIKQDWSEIATFTFIPVLSFDHQYLMNIVAILGTTISPYLFFWQANEEVELQIATAEESGIARHPATNREIKGMRKDTFAGMFFSNLIMFFIIVTTASTLNKHGIHSIQTADQAAEALRPLAGNFAFLLFTIGIIGTGLLALPVLAGSSAYAVAETLGWREGLSKKFSGARKFYMVIVISTLAGLLLNFTSIPPFKMLYYTAIFNGIAAPPLLVLILLIANNKKIMGAHTNSLLSNVIGILITMLMFIASISFLCSF